MNTYTITLTDVESKALAHAVVDPQDWIENFVKVRCQTAIDEIFQAEVQRMLNDSEVKAIPADREEVVRNANVVSAKEKQEQRLAEIASNETPIG